MGKSVDKQPRSCKPAPAQEQASRAAMIARNKSEKERQAAEHAERGRARMAAALLGAQQQRASADAPTHSGEAANNQPTMSDVAGSSSAPQEGAAAALAPENHSSGAPSHSGVAITHSSSSPYS